MTLVKAREGRRRPEGKIVTAAAGANLGERYIWSG